MSDAGNGLVSFPVEYEAVVFKQYDFRESTKQAGHALATFHCSTPDPYSVPFHNALVRLYSDA